MDRRTQIAFLLIAVILGINYLLMDRLAPPREAEPLDRDSAETNPAQDPARPDFATSQPDRDTTSPTSPGATPPGTTPQATSPTPTASAAQARRWFQLADGTEGDIVVETPLQIVRISRAGALLQDVTLPHYEHAGREGLVDLVPNNGSDVWGAALGLVLSTPEGEIDLSTTRFDPIEPYIQSVTRLDAGSGPRTLSFRATATDGGGIVKRFTFDPDFYEIQLDVDFERGGRLQQIDRVTLQWTTGMATTEANTKDDQASSKLLIKANDELSNQGISPGFMSSITGRAPEGERVGTFTGQIDWLAMKSKYFLVAVVPENKNGAARLRSDASREWMGFELSKPQPFGATTRQSFRLYAGPISYNDLKAQGSGLHEIVDLGWKPIRPFSWAILRFMQFLNTFIPNYGVIILIISVLTKVIFWPLAGKSFKSMREMQEIQPLMQRLREQHKGDPQEVNRQVMALYKQRGVNPLGGCMPLLVQMPIFVALFSVLRSNIELRNAPFFGWIDNLAAPDVLFHLPVVLPVVGNNFSLLPLLMGGSMIWQSKMGSPMAMSGPAAQQQKLMKWMMPIMFTFIFYNMPSGLVLYWLVNTVLSVAQQIQINRKYDAAPPMSTEVVLDSPPKERKDNGAPDRKDRGQRRGGSRSRSRGTGSKTR